MKLLPKGLPVVYVCPAFPDIEEDKEFDEENKIKSTRFMGLSFICAFVAGDTEEDGFSIVALDNPELCLMSVNPYSKYINQDRESILKTGCYEAMKEEYNPFFYHAPECQFS